MKKRIVALLLGTCMVATMLVGCGSSGSTSTDTEQKTESSNNEQGTEGITDSTEEEVKQDKYNPNNHYLNTLSDGREEAEGIIYQYITGYNYRGDYIPEFANFLASDTSSEGKEALKKLYDLYNMTSPAYRNGELVIDTLAYSISYDDENYQLINSGDLYSITENTTTAVLYNIILNPSENSKDCKPFNANLIIVLRKGNEVNNWGSVVGMYSLDSANKYFPDLNHE